MGYFIDRDHRPTEGEIQTALGSRYPLWRRLTHFVENQGQVDQKWSFWGPQKSGWNLRYRRKGRALVALYPQQEQILVNVVLGERHVEKAHQLVLGGKVKILLNAAPQLQDGCWLFIPVVDEADVMDIEQLLLVKMDFIKGED